MEVEMSRRTAFTIVELMVSLAIIGLIATVFLPAVQFARQAARRAQCQNNLRQIGLAILNYESTYHVLPHGLSMRYDLLPFLGLQNLHSLYDPNPTSTQPEAAWARLHDKVIPTYICPSDHAPALRQGLFAAASSYPACYGSGLLINGFDGAFGLWHYTMSGYASYPLRMSDIIDGPSNVAAVGEWLHSDAHKSRLRVRWQTPKSYGPTEVDAFRHLCETLPRDPVSFGWLTVGTNRGFPWYNGGLGVGQYNHMLPPNRPSCNNRIHLPTGIHTAGSQHLGGAHVLYVDGHVVFHSESVDFRVWQRLGSRNDATANTSP